MLKSSCSCWHSGVLSVGEGAVCVAGRVSRQAARRWLVGLAVCVLALLLGGMALAEAPFVVDVTALHLSADSVASGSPVTMTADIAPEAFTAGATGRIGFYVQEGAGSGYRLLSSLPVSGWDSAAHTATYTHAAGFAAGEAVSIMARYVPGSGETSCIAGASASATLTTHGVETFADLKRAMESAQGTVEITLNSDVAADETISLFTGADITLNGNGHTITVAVAERLFAVQAASLKLTDVTLDGTGCTRTGSLIYVGVGQSVTLSDGLSIKNMTGESDDLVVYGVRDSTVRMEGNAAITACTITNGASGCLALNGGSLIMTDAARIANCQVGGSGGAVILVNAATATLSGAAAIEQCSAGNTGGGIYCYGNGASITLSENAAIRSCTASIGGGGIYAGSAKEVILQDSAVVSDCTADGDGGGLYLSGTLFTMKDTTCISGSTATGNNGGGVYLENSNATMSGCAIIEGNTAGTSGGGIYTSGSTTLAMSGSACILRNEAKSGEGGGVYAKKVTMTMTDAAAVNSNTASMGGGGIFSTGTLTMDGSTMVNGNKSSDGGGIYSGNTLLLKGNASITANEAITEGGGIWMSSGKLTVQEDALISRNTSLLHGGGLLMNGVELTMSGGQIAGNTSGGGGGIAMQSSGCNSVELSGTAMIADNTAECGGGVNMTCANTPIFKMRDQACIVGNTATMDGGGVYVDFYHVATLDTYNIRFELSGHASISGNRADGRGGGFYDATEYQAPYSGVPTDRRVQVWLSEGANLSANETSDYYYRQGSATFPHIILERYYGSCGVYFSDFANQKTLPVAGARNGSVGFMDVEDFSVQGLYSNNAGSGCFRRMPVNLGGTTYDCAVYDERGTNPIHVYYATTDQSLRAYSPVFDYPDLTGCMQRLEDNGGGYWWIRLSAPMTQSEALALTKNNHCIITGAPITSAVGASPSLFSVTNGASLTLDGVRLQSARTMTHFVKNESSLTLRNGATLAGNDTSAILADPGSTTNIEPGAVIRGNVLSSGKGGGIYSRGAVNMTGGLISENVVGSTKTSSYGGGMYIDFPSGSTLSISGGRISKNTAGFGGGIFVERNMTVSGGAIEQNTAHDGGGVFFTYDSSSTLTMTGGHLGGNAATSAGGGIRCVYGEMLLSGGMVVGNQATSDGGGINTESGKGITVKGTAVIADNTASSGGGVYAKKMNMSGQARLLRNDAKAGGGVCVTEALDMGEDAEIVGNRAVNYGAGAELWGGNVAEPVRITGGTIFHNGFLPASGSTNTLLGGGLFMTAYSTTAITVEISNCRITGNTAVGGGGVYAGDALPLKMTDVEVSGNTATMHGGGVCNASRASALFSAGAKDSMRIVGNVASDQGGGIYSSGPVTLDGVQVAFNRAIGGGGIRGGLNAECTLTNTDVVSNICADLGGGLCIVNDRLTVDKATTVTGNYTQAGQRSNLYLADGKKLNMTSAERTGRIGVTLQHSDNPTSFTQNTAATAQTMASFFSDDRERYVDINSANDLVLDAGTMVVRVDAGAVSKEFKTLDAAFAAIHGMNTTADPAIVTVLQPVQTTSTLQVGTGDRVVLRGESITRDPSFADNPMLAVAGELTLSAITLNGAGLDGAPLIEVGEKLIVDGAVLRNSQSNLVHLLRDGQLELVSGMLYGWGSASGTPTIITDGAAKITLSGGSIMNSDVALSGVDGQTADVLISGTAIDRNGTGILCNDAIRLTLSGNPVIANNTQQDLYLGSGQSAVLDGALGEGAYVGVLTQDQPTMDAAVLVATSAASGSEARFHADNTNYQIVPDPADATRLVLSTNGRTIPAPTVNRMDTTTVALDPVTPSIADTGDVIAYGWSLTATAPAAADPVWQTSTDFTGLTPNTAYYFFARVTGGAKYLDAVSTGTAVTTSGQFTVTLIGTDPGIAGFSTSADGSSWTTYTAPVTVYTGDDLWVRAEMNPGYAFQQWATDVTANPLLLGSISASVTLTPVTQANAYTVTLIGTDPGIAGFATSSTFGASWTTYTGPVAVHAGNDLRVRAEMNLGYAFVQWADGMTANPMQLTDINASVTLTPTTQITTYTVTYDDNGATSPHIGGDTTYTIATRFFRLPTSPVLPGNRFAGWRVTVGAQGGSGFNADDLITETFHALSHSWGDVTLTAQWQTPPADPAAAGNRIDGIPAGATYLQGTVVTFTAVGAGMDNTSPSTGDYRWKPDSWETNPSGDFESGYTQRFDTSAIRTGSHTLTVTFVHQRYDGQAWVTMNPAVTDEKQVRYTVTAAPVPPQTGDNGQPWLWLMLGALSVLALAWMMKRKKAA